MPQNTSGSKDNAIFNNALSVGWHLRRVVEQSDFLLDDNNWKDFVVWMERHCRKDYKNFDKDVKRINADPELVKDLHLINEEADRILNGGMKNHDKR